MKPTFSHLSQLWSGVMVCLLTATTMAACLSPLSPPSHSGNGKIKHIIVIMQENRSFDSYFGTYPGADGIPMHNGVPTVCVNDPQTGQCVKPYHNTQNLNHGGPHGAPNATADIDSGKMDGFIAQAERGKGSCINPEDPACSANGQTDVMGYHTAQEIPNYWSYAKNFVLQDHMFEPDASWSLPSHLFMVSAWSARCRQKGDPQSCINNIQGPVTLQRADNYKADYAWTDLTYLLHKANVSWAYYVAPGTEPDCEDDAASCTPVKQGPKTPGIWNPLPDFDTVQQDGQLSNIERGRSPRCCGTPITTMPGRNNNDLASLTAEDNPYPHLYSSYYRQTTIIHL